MQRNRRGEDGCGKRGFEDGGEVGLEDSEG